MYMVDIRYFDVNRYVKNDVQIPDLLIRQMLKERKNGNLVFVCAKYPYYEVHKKFYKYANGFVTNDACYVQMGCCEVLFSHAFCEQEILDLYEKLQEYAALVLYSVKDSYVCKADSSKNKRIHKYCLKNSVYSCSVILQNRNDVEMVEKLVEDQYFLESCENSEEYLLVRKKSLQEMAADSIAEYFK